LESYKKIQKQTKDRKQCVFRVIIKGIYLSWKQKRKYRKYFWN